MSLKDKWKDLIGVGDYEEEDFDEEEVAEEKPFRRSEPSFNAAPKAMESPMPRTYEVPKSTIDAAPAPRITSTKSIQLKMVVKEPHGYDECPDMVDNLKAKKPLVINLEHLETDVARKIFDFLSGATYALNGNVQKVANNIFVFSPDNVDVAYSKTRSEEGYKSPWK